MHCSSPPTHSTCLAHLTKYYQREEIEENVTGEITEMRNTHKILVEKPGGKISLGRSRSINLVPPPYYDTRSQCHEIMSI
jgi:hypothetical protein